MVSQELNTETVIVHPYDFAYQVYFIVLFCRQGDDHFLSDTIICLCKVVNEGSTARDISQMGKIGCAVVVNVGADGAFDSLVGSSFRRFAGLWHNLPLIF